eukprot:2625018-Amphidinium_carterae.1
MVVDDDEKKPHGIVLVSRGNELSSSDSEEDAGAQDAQDRMTEGPLTARKLGHYKPDYSPTSTKPIVHVTRQPTGSDALWRAKLALNSSGQPTTGRYECVACGARFPLSNQVADHMLAIHHLAIEPNIRNEYSVGE